MGLFKMERSKKKKVSNILLEKREWFDVNEKKPNPGERVVIRFTNENIVYGENDKEVYYAEDIKVGRYLQAIEGEGGRWVIDPPYPKYDYSPLSNKENLLEGTYVTHWAYPESDELEGWDTRFDMHNKYQNLRIEIDPEHEEDLYRAIIWTSAFFTRNAEIRKRYDEKTIDRIYGVLCDLQSCIDNDIYIKNGEKIKYDRSEAFMNPLVENISEESPELKTDAAEADTIKEEFNQ